LRQLVHADRGAPGLAPIRLGDFLNPTGDEPFQSGSPHASGGLKPRALLLELAHAWSPASQGRAARLLPGVLDEARRRRTDVLLWLVEGERPGQPADSYNLIGFTRRFNVSYPAAMEPSGRLAAIAGAEPRLLLVDTRSMKVIAVSTGADLDAAFRAAWDETLRRAP
jgi:hypothetical protein